MARRVTPSLLLDTAPSTRRQPGDGSVPMPSSPVSWTYGKITATAATDTSLPPGWVEVGIPYGNPVSRAVGESDGISTWVGARVMVILDTTGRVIKISDPIAEPGPDDDVQHLGQTGRRLKKALDDAVKAQRAADQVRDNAREAESKASQAAKDAAKALKIGESNRPPHVGKDVPKNPPLGMLWYPTDERDNIIAARLWDGNQWLPRPLVADSVLVPGSVGDASIKDGAITAPKIYASKELSAKIGAFLEVTTDMLTAGNATIPGTAVVGDLIGNRLMGGELSLLDSEPATQTQTADFRNGVEGWSANTSYLKSMVMDQGNGELSFRLAKLEGFQDPPPYIPIADHVGVFGPTQGGMGDITLTLELSIAVPASETGRVVCLLQDGTIFTTEFSAPQNTRTPIVIQIPENKRLADGKNITVFLSSKNGSFRMKIHSMTCSWKPLLKSGMRIFRDAKGVAKIEISDTIGGVTTLDSSGISYRPIGGVDSTRRWKTFTTPPLLSTVVRKGTGGAKGDQWRSFVPNQNGEWETLNRGGFVVTENGFQVPADGFYRLSANVWFRAIERYTVGAGVVTQGGIDALGLYTYGETGRNTWRNIFTTGIRRLTAGTTVAPAFYHDFDGFWAITDLSFSAEFLHDAD